MTKYFLPPALIIIEDENQTFSACLLTFKH